jgi:hypothetical protein
MLGAAADAPGAAASRKYVAMLWVVKLRMPSVTPEKATQ